MPDDASPQWPLLYVGFNSRVIALDRASGSEVWNWKSPAGSGFPALLVEVPHVFVSVNGYTYCLDAASGEQLWDNPLKGYGMGTAVLAVEGRSSDGGGQAAAIAAQQAAAAAS